MEFSHQESQEYKAKDTTTLPSSRSIGLIKVYTSDKSWHTVVFLHLAEVQYEHGVPIENRTKICKLCYVFPHLNTERTICLYGRILPSRFYRTDCPKIVNVLVVVRSERHKDLFLILRNYE